MDITGSPTMASPRGGCACHIARSTLSEADQAVPGTPIGSANLSNPTKSFQLRLRCWPAVPTLRRGHGCASRYSDTMPPDIPRSRMAEASTAAGIPSIPEGGIPQRSSRRSSTDEGGATCQSRHAAGRLHQLKTARFRNLCQQICLPLRKIHLDERGSSHRLCFHLVHV